MVKKSNYWNNNLIIIQSIILILIVTPLIRLYTLNQSLIYVIPNLLLFTGYRQLARDYWHKYVKIDKRFKRDPQHIPSIDASNYTFEVLKEATENWRYPAVVRGLFKNTPAISKWIDPNYLPIHLGEFNIPVVRKAVYGTLQNNRTVMTFAESFGEIMKDLDSKMYLIFPVKSRVHLNHSDVGVFERLQAAVNKVVLEDLEIDKLIWPGFGTKIHKTFFASQLFIGQGSSDTTSTTGTGWHCAAGNNWFVQVAGRKRWYFMDTQYSAYMYPLRGGKVHMMTSNHMGELHDYLPLRYVDLEAGDLLYNPDWQWHTIYNHEGLSIGVPMREVNLTLSFRNNFHYSSIVIVNKLFDALGIDIGGYQPS